MEDEILVFNDSRIQQSLKILSSKYPDDLVKNDLIVAFKEPKPIKYEAMRESSKRSLFSNIILHDSKIIQSAYTGSKFNNLTIVNCEINGNSFVSCIFEKLSLTSESKKKCIGNNFSNSNVNKCRFENADLESCSWINSNVEFTEFLNFKINSCTLEGSYFINCTFKNVDMSIANLDYMILDKSKLINVKFPFYQFAYVIGAANYLNENNQNDFCFMVNNKTIKLSEYKSNITQLIYYYYSRKEYFPLSNLLIAQGNCKLAKNFISIGISQSLDKNDFRMIKHYCVLTKHYNLLDYDLTKRIKTSLINYLLRLSDENDLMQALIKTSEINNIIDDRTTNQTYLQFEIQTNIDRLDENKQEIINDLIMNCKYILDNPVFNISGHTIKEISYCPVELIFQVIGGIADLLSVAGALQKLVCHFTIQKSKDIKKITKHICKEYENLSIVDSTTRIDLAKAKIEQSMQEIRQYRGVHSGKKYNQFISEITQKIIGDVDNILDKNMVVMKLNI